MNPKLSWLAMVPALLALAACSVFEGSKYDESTAPEGSVERRMTRTPDEISKASTEAIQELGMTVQSDQHDALGGRMVAQRATPGKEEVIVWYKSLDPTNTALAVKVGAGDRHLAELVQDRIAQHLGTAAALAVPAVGAVAEGFYDPPVAQCTTAMEQALRDLRMSGIRRETHDTWSFVSAREADAIPVEAKIERTEKDKTRVHITAGTTQNQDTRQLADRVKAQFEEKVSQAPAR